jgi:hypothetical protein
MAMEKNGNTLAPGDPVVLRSDNVKLASQSYATLETIDPDTNRAKIAFADGSTTFVDLDELERAG